MGKEYLYEFAENALKEALLDVTNSVVLLWQNI